MITSSYDVEEFVDAIRILLGKKPLPEEPPLQLRVGRMARVVTLDGERWLPELEWSRLLRISRQAVWARVQLVQRRQHQRDPDPYRGMATVSRAQRKGQATRGVSR